MTMIATSEPLPTTRERQSGRQGRLTAALGQWAAGLARRRFVNRVMAETLDPAVLAELGIRPATRSHVERWVMAMLWHQH